MPPAGCADLTRFSRRMNSPIRLRSGQADGPVELFAELAAANPTFYANPANPQSLSKYAYVYNNPLRYVDPTGHVALRPMGGPANGKQGVMGSKGSGLALTYPRERRVCPHGQIPAHRVSRSCLSRHLSGR
jgi:hypothetical protein